MSLKELKNPLIHNGTAQAERNPDALDPASVQLDERTEGQLLNFAYEFAEVVKFYDLKNEVNGNWQCFFGKSPAAMLAIIASIDVAVWKAEYCQLEVDFWTGVNAGKENYSPLIDHIHALAVKLYQLCAELPKGMPLKKEMQAVIRGDLGRVIFDNRIENALERLIKYDKGTRKVAVLDNHQELKKRYDRFVTKTDSSNCVKAWGLEDIFCLIADDGFKEPQPDDGCKENRKLRTLFMFFYRALVKVVQLAKAHLKTELAQNQAHPAHLTLFLAFVRLFGHLQADLNDLTRRHLDFYLEQVLCLEKRKFVPDEVYTIFELSKSFREFKLDAGALLDAKKDAEGNPRYYALKEEFVVTKSEVAIVATDGFCSVGEGNDEILKHHAEINFDWTKKAKERLGRGGVVSLGKCMSDDDRLTSALELVLADPIFKLSDGERKVTLKMGDEKLANAVERVAFSTNSNALGYFEIASENIETVATVDTLDEGDLQITLSSSDPPVNLPTAEKSSYLSGLRNPYVKLFFNYNSLTEVQSSISTITANVKVTEHAKGLQIDNGYGVYARSESFLVGGVSQQAEGALKVTSKDLEGKSLIVDGEVPPKINTGLILQALIDIDNKYLTDKNIDVIEEIYDHQDFQIPGFQFEPDIPLGPGFNPDILYNVNSGGPSTSIYYPGYGQPSFNRLKATNTNSSTETKKAADEAHDNKLISYSHQQVSYLNFGYIIKNDVKYPSGKIDSINYEAETELSPLAPEFQLYHVTKIGHRLIDIANQDVSELLAFLNQLSLRTEESEEITKNLYLGLKNLTPGEMISLLFEVAEGSGDYTLDLPEVNWSYQNLRKNGAYGWTDFGISDQILDTTKGDQASKNSLAQTGIVRLNIPTDIVRGGTQINAGNDFHWIRATIKGEVKALPKIVDIRAQAARAIFTDRNNSHEHLETQLAGETINKLKAQPAAIKKVEQPFSSFGGRPREKTQAFYSRTSERLRHRDRAINLYDYERLLLEKFPEVRHAKCITHTDDKIDLCPGHVRLVVVPYVAKHHAENQLTPGFSRGKLEEMAAYLRSKAPLSLQCGGRLSVGNPHYEMIRAVGKLKFFPGRSPTFYEEKTKADMQRFLAPWAFEDEHPIRFNGIIYRSEVLNFLEKLPYVDKVTDFKLELYRADGEYTADAPFYSGFQSDSLFTAYSDQVGIESYSDDKQEFLQLLACDGTSTPGS